MRAAWWLARCLAGGARAIGAAVLSPACPCCGIDMGWGIRGVCAACWSEVLPAGSGCELCAGPLSPEESGGRCKACTDRSAADGGPPFSALVAWGHYHGRLKDLVHAFKYGGCPRLAGPLAERLAGALLDRGLGARLAGCRVVPVPLAADRRRRRGYDQALLLARGLAGALRRRKHAPSGVSRALRRLRDGPPQTGLARKERLVNPRGAYGAEASIRLVRGVTTVLVDDVLTTGATADECSRLLLHAGAREVIVAVAARTPARGANPRSRGGSGGGKSEIE